MKPSALRMRAISIFTRLDGIMTISWRAPDALRIRVSMSATGSFTATPRGRRAFGTITRRGRGASPSARSGRGTWGSGVFVVTSVVMLFSPTRLCHARQLAGERALAEADPAEPELPHVPAGPTAHLAAVVALALESRRLQRLQDQALLRHLATPLGRTERHPQRF